MLRVIICSDLDLAGELRLTVIGRGNVDRFRSTRIEEIRRLAAAVAPQAILVDRDLPQARELIEALRKEKTTRHRSIALLARGKPLSIEDALVAAGANVVLRLPPDRDWDGRLARLLDVAGRQNTRLE